MTIAMTATIEQLVDAGGRPEASFHRRSLPYVSGTVVRGAFAQRWIAEHGLPTASDENRQVFTEIFHRTIHWGQLVPYGAAVKPLSLLEHKHRERFDGVQCDATGIDRAYLSDEERLQSQMTCSHGGCRLEPAKGRWSNTAQLLASRTRAGLIDSGERREVAEDGKLFTREGIGVGSVLVGRVHGSHDWLSGLIGQRDPIIAVRFGGQKSVNGRSLIELSADVDTPDAPAPFGDPTRVVIVAESPCVLVDDSGRPQLNPRLGELAELAGSSAEIIGSWARPVTIGGWDLISGLPKPEEVAVVAGSTWLVQFDGPVGAAGLARLQAGIGLRRVEGYGSVRVNPSMGSDDPSPPPTKLEEPKSDLRILATEVRRAFTSPNADTDWAAGLLLDLATEMTVAEPATDAPSRTSVVDRAMTRARVRRLETGERNVLAQAVAQSPDDIRKLAMLVKAGL